MTGHVFVVPGSLDGLDCDDVLIPTDHWLTVETTWHPALGWPEGQPDRQELAGVGQLSDQRRAAQLPHRDGTPRRWLISVAGHRGPDVGWLIDGVASALDAVASGPVRKGRVRQRVAMPTLGVAGGGYNNQRGQVIWGLLRVAGEKAAEHGIDVVIVAFDPADYSAFQTEWRALATPLREGQEEVAQRLAALAGQGRLALFMGAGTGMSAGLPSWNGLLAQLAAMVGLDFDAARWDALGPLDSAELLRRAAVAPAGPGRSLGHLVAEVVGTARRYALSHVLLAALNCEQAITTNFDRLYEDAVKAITGQRPLTVLPNTDAHELVESGRDHWLLKLHGDAQTPESIVLDRRSFVTFDAKRRPLGGVLQTTLLTKHLLMVGASMTDDNVIRLIHEVAALTERDGAVPPLGTVLALEADELRARLWEPEFAYLDLSSEDGGLDAAARNLEIFLDRVVLLTTSTHAHLLDPRYAELLADDRHRQVAQQALALFEAIQGLQATPDSAWAALSSDLRRFGATGHDGPPQPDRRPRRDPA